MGIRDDYDQALIDASAELRARAKDAWEAIHRLHFEVESSLAARADNAEGPPDTNSMVRLWNEIVLLRLHANALHEQWKRVNRAGQDWCVVWNENVEYVDETLLTYREDER